MVNRREFLAAVSAGGAVALLPSSDLAAAPSAAFQRGPAPAKWPIGSHTRPFAGFRATESNPDYILDAVKAAGFEYADMISAAPPAPPRGAGARAGAAPPPQARAAI